jgi:hypothetical protein
VLSIALSGCGLFEPETVGLCKEAMNLTADQLKMTQPDRQKLMDGCKKAPKSHTAEQWKCIITAIKSGTASGEATSSCTAR